MQMISLEVTSVIGWICIGSASERAQNSTNRTYTIIIRNTDTIDVTLVNSVDVNFLQIPATVINVMNGV